MMRLSSIFFYHPCVVQGRKVFNTLLTSHHPQQESWDPSTPSLSPACFRSTIIFLLLATMVSVFSGFELKTSAGEDCGELHFKGRILLWELHLLKEVEVAKERQPGTHQLPLQWTCVSPQPLWRSHALTWTSSPWPAHSNCPPFVLWKV